MTFAPTPNVGPSLMFETLATISVPTMSHDATGGASRSYTTVSNVPCSIQSGAGSESLKYGAGHAHESRGLFTGYFPALKADGTKLTITAESKITADGVPYYAAGPGSAFGDGAQSVPLEVIT